MSIESPAAVAAAPARSRPLGGTFASLRHRNFRLLWAGTLISSTGDWMDQIALNWLILTLTDSAVYLGLVNLCRAGPILLLTLVGGVAADRFDRRKMLFTTQSIAMLLAALLGALVWTQTINVGLLLLIAAGRGTMMAFNQPARHSLLPDLVPRRDLVNAVALNSATLSSTRVIGPAIGGVLIAAIGVGGAFFVNALTFIGVLTALALMTFPPRAPRPAPAPAWRSMVEGLRYIKDDPILSSLVLLMIVPIVLGMPYLAMLTVFARDVLMIGPVGLGVLSSAAGFGSVAGALAIASLGGYSRKGLLMLGCMLAFGACIVGFSLSPWPVVSGVLVAGLAGGNTAAVALNNAFLQSRAADEFRGRVMSVTFLERGFVPLGTSAAGVGAEFFGAPLTLATMGALIVVFVLAAAARVPALRQLE
jgi:MFS family permease